MPTKRIIVLANSAKNDEHCIAGKEVFVKNNKVTYGGWIRPVSRRGDEGAISIAQCSFKGGRCPRIWDIVDVPVEEPESYAPQPENWIIDETKSWSKVALDFELPGVPLDAPPNLWIDATQKNDRVYPANLASINQNASLYLVQPQNLCLRVGWYSFRDEPPKHRRRAYFDYKGVSYDLAMRRSFLGRRVLGLRL